jgi:hypothetical protein
LNITVLDSGLVNVGCHEDIDRPVVVIQVIEKGLPISRRTRVTRVEVGIPRIETDAIDPGRTHEVDIGLPNILSQTKRQNNCCLSAIPGSTRDVYPIILKALALDPPQLNHRYQQLNDRIKGVLQLCSHAVIAG